METITFYSYKGGVGRTLALANFARHLATNGHRVFVVDFDLEAPGVHYKLQPTDNNDTSDKKGLGLVSYINYWQSQKTKVIPKDESFSKYVYEHRINAHTGDQTTINVMPAGDSRSSNYWDGVGLINWHNLFVDSPKDSLGLLRRLKKQIKRCFNTDYLLIDARTGITPVGGIATTLMLPNSVVLLFNKNKENLDGVIRVAEAVSQVFTNQNKAKIKIFPVTVRLPAIDPEFDQSLKKEIDKEFEEKLQRNNGQIQPCHILHTDREVEVTESLLIGNSKANESSILYKDYQTLFDRLTGKEISDDVLPEAEAVDYSERMSRLIHILNELKADPNSPTPQNLLKKIEIGAITNKPTRDPNSDQPRTQWTLEEIKKWEPQLPETLKSFGGLQEFWVLLPKFLAFDDPDFLEITGNNLMEGAKYIYFLPNADDVIKLKTVAIEIVNNLTKNTQKSTDDIKQIVQEKLRYVFVTERLFRAYLRHLNYWIPNPNNPFPYSESCPAGFEVVTDKGRAVAAVPITSKECEEICKLVNYSLRTGKDLSALPYKFEEFITDKTFFLSN